MPGWIFTHTARKIKSVEKSVIKTQYENCRPMNPEVM